MFLHEPQSQRQPPAMERLTRCQRPALEWWTVISLSLQASRPQVLCDSEADRQICQEGW